MTKQPLRAPFPWFGGKRRVADEVWRRFGDVPNYVEPFAGSLAVLLARPHAPKTETVNDKDCYIANFWRAVAADPEQVAYWADWPVNEADLHARHVWLVNTASERIEFLKTDPDFYDAQVAGWWVWGVCQWIGSGWCHRPEWKARPALGNAGTGVHAPARQVRHLSSGGMGVHQKRPHLMTGGRGVHRKMPSLGDAGRGEPRALHHPARQLPEVVSDRGVRNPAIRDDLLGTFEALGERLRRVRVVCGDWRRVTGPSVTFKNGTTGVFLDPPYSFDERSDDGDRIYAEDGDGIADAVRRWAIENGTNPELRIALCGYEGEHAMPPEWSTFEWKAAGGYGSQGEGRARENAARERIWFSPHCLGPHSAQLSLPMDEVA